MSKRTPQRPQVSDHVAFDRKETEREYRFWPRSDTKRVVTTRGAKWFDARERAAILLGVAAQDVTDR